MNTATGQPPGAPPSAGGVSPGYAIVAGMCASLVAIGLARFAYTPLIPLLIQARWFSASDVVYLGAANFAGYFVGALSGRRLAAGLGRRAVLRAMMLLTAVAFLACAWPLSLLWFFVWRFLSGLAGAVVMVLLAQTILPLVAPSRRGFVSGAIFMGIGAGICVSGIVLPWLLKLGLTACWAGMAAISGVFALLTWPAWPEDVQSAAHADGSEHGPVRMPLAVRLLYVEYAAIAAGLVPAAVFLVDLIARGLHQGAAHGAAYWTLYGAGAVAGPLLYGLAADHIGFGKALRLGILLSGLAALFLAELHPIPALVVASLLLGAFTPGVVTLMIGRLHELLAHDHHAQHVAWSRLTTMFALSQAVSGYFYSYLFAKTGGNYELINLAGLGAFALALAAEVPVLFLARDRNGIKQAQGGMDVRGN